MAVNNERERRSKIRMSDIERAVDKVFPRVVFTAPPIDKRIKFKYHYVCSMGCGYPVPTPDSPCGECVIDK